MEIEDIDRVVLNAVRDESPARPQDVHSYFTRMTGLDILRPEINESLDRLLALHLIEDASDDMDFHPHYRPVNLLEAIARAASDDSGREDAGRPGLDHGDAPLPRGVVRRPRIRHPQKSEHRHDTRRALARAQSRGRFWDAVARLLGLDPKT